jgi:valyl-tRNA synthetase
MVMPPTNANGNLHAGHGLVMTIEDIVTRYKRMQGFQALWRPGLDHAGFETQVVYEKKLEKEGRSRFDMRLYFHSAILMVTIARTAAIITDVVLPIIHKLGWTKGVPSIMPERSPFRIEDLQPRVNCAAK